MKTAFLIAALTLAPTVARAGEVIPGFFDLQKAMADSDEGKKDAADEKADLAAKQAEVTKAQEAAKAADAACSKGRSSGQTPSIVDGDRIVSEPKACTDARAAHVHAEELGQRDQQEITQRQQGDAQRLADRIKRILPAIAKAKHLGAIVPLGGAFYAGPALDQTSEVVRRLNAGEGKDDEQVRAENAQLKAKVAALEAEKKAAPPPPAKPTAPK